jgi:hypothetical protein
MHKNALSEDNNTKTNKNGLASMKAVIRGK